MTNKTIFLHVGLYKTGTSALQTLFYHNQQLLLSKGVKYATTGLYGGAHFALAGVCRRDLSKDDNEDFNTLKNELRLEIVDTQSDALLFSCEDFERCDEDMLGEFFEGQTVKVIVYLRRQDLFAESWAAQMEKMGEFYGNQDRYRPISRLKPAEKAKILLIDYRAWLDRLAAVFGKRNIIVRAYEKLQLPNGVIPDFLDILGIEYSGDFEVHEADPNPSLRYRDLIEFKYLANQNPVPNDPLRSPITQLELAWRNDPEKPSASALLSPQERLDILERFDHDNQFIAREYMQNPDGILFREPWPSAHEPWHPYTGLTAQTAVEISSWITANQQNALAYQGTIIQQHGQLINQHQQLITQLHRQVNNLEDKIQVGSNDIAPINEELIPGSKKLFFFFGGIANEIGMPPFEFYRASRILDYSKIFLRDSSQSWYQSGLPAIGDDAHAIGEYLRKKITESGASQIRFVGNSMGGYAALLFCSILQCGKAVVFSPQTFISLEKRRQYGDERWASLISAMHTRQGASGIYDLKSWIQKSSPEMHASVYVSSADALDTVHANELSDFTGIKIHRFTHGGHELVTKLRDDGHLAQILNE